MFPDYKEAHKFAFRVCWKCEMARPCKPFAWKPKSKGAEYPIRWRTFKEARKAMWEARGREEVSLDLSDKGIDRLREVHRRRFREKGFGHWGAKRDRGGHRG